MSYEFSESSTTEDQILDIGACAAGVQLIIFDCTGGVPRILRPGGITVEMIK